MEDSADALARVPLFAGVGKRQLKRLAGRMTARTFQAGETAVEEGKPGAGFWLIEDGEAEVSVKGNVVRKLGAGDYFGEIALLDDGPRSATVTAASTLRCRGMGPWEFKPFVIEHPDIAWTMLQALARELRQAESREGATARG